MIKSSALSVLLQAKLILFISSKTNEKIKYGDYLTLETLRFIIFPQALSYVIPVYKNEVVTLIKLTSIAGYISIMDLTKASDIIRNRTYEAFFPLIITAIIYFIITPSTFLYILP